MSMYRDRTMVWVLAATLASTSLGAQMAANNAVAVPDSEVVTRELHDL